MPYYNDYLAHYGVKGMKWGVRRERRNTYNKNYTDRQRKQDRAVYGHRAERRINRRMNEGYGVKGARAIEADRKARVDRRKATARRVGKKITRAAVSVGSAFVMDQIFYEGRNTKATISLAKDAVKLGKYAVNNLKNMRI